MPDLTGQIDDRGLPYFCIWGDKSCARHGDLLKPEDGYLAAIRVMLLFRKNSDANQLEIAREVKIRSSLRHENILRFLGLARGQPLSSAFSDVAIVLPKIGHGTVMQYLHLKPTSDVRKLVSNGR